MIVNPDEYTGVIYYVAKDEGNTLGIRLSPYFSAAFMAKIWLWIWGRSGHYCIQVTRYR